MPYEFTFKHDVNMDLSVPSANELPVSRPGSKSKRKKEKRVYVQYNIKNDLKHMLRMTSMMEENSPRLRAKVNRQRSRMPATLLPHPRPKSTSSSPPPVPNQKPPRPLLPYQYPSLALRGLKIVKQQKRTSARSTEPRRPLTEEDMMLPPEERRRQREARPHSTDRVLAISERFGKIVKNQSRGSSQRRGKENSVQAKNTAVAPVPVPSSKPAGLIIRQKSKPSTVRATSPITSPQSRIMPTISDNKHTHLERLLARRAKTGVADPLGRFVWQTLARGKAEFEGAAENSRGIYTVAMRELNNTMIKQRQSAHQFGEETMFCPELLLSLRGKVDEDRWFQLYLIKILYKKPLISKIKYLQFSRSGREIFVLQEKLAGARTEHKSLLKKFVKLQQMLLRRAKAPTVKSSKPFLCGAPRAVTPAHRRPEERSSPPRDDQQTVQDLQLRQMMCRDKVEKLEMKLAFEVIRLQYLISRERKSYLDLVLGNADKAGRHFFLGSWLHYVKIRREKRELVELARGRLAEVLSRAMLLAWRSAKRVIAERHATEEIVLEKMLQFRKKSVFRSLHHWKLLSRRKKLLAATSSLLARRTLAAKSLHDWQYEARYQRGMKARAKAALSRGVDSVLLDRMALHRECMADIRRARRAVLGPARVELKEFAVPKLFSTQPNKAKYEAPVGSAKRSTVHDVHRALLRYQTELGWETAKMEETDQRVRPQNNTYKRLEARTGSGNRLVFPIDVSSRADIGTVKRHAMSVLAAIRAVRTNRGGAKTLVARRQAKCIAQWKSAYLSTVLAGDLAVLRALPVWKGFIKQLKEYVHD